MLENPRITQTDQEIAGSARFFRSLLEERLTGAKGKSENLLISIRSLNSLFDHLMILSDESIQQPGEYRNARAADSFGVTETATAGPGFTAFVR
jgi:hypothetical protein